MTLRTVFCIVFAVYFFLEVEGHGYMVTPPNRASLWRTYPNQPTNFNDNEYFCGGTFVQYYKNEGRCGPCGDDWRDPIPRSNENGGKFGNGIIAANYIAGSVIEVTSLITANHLGRLYFHICKLNNASQPDTEECFRPLKFADGDSYYLLDPQDYKVEVKLRLPKDFICERCVLRWHYRTGNSWGMCDDGTQNIGCGNQEIFRSCADIRITSNNSSDEDSSDSEEQPSDTDEGPSDSDEDLSDSDEYHDAPCILNPHYNRRRNMEFK